MSRRVSLSALVALVLLSGCAGNTGTGSGTAGGSPVTGGASPGTTGTPGTAGPSGTTGTSQEPVIIGIIVGLSGANSTVAPSVVQAAQLAVDELNNSGGILGRPVALQVFDDGSGPDGALKAFNSAILEKKVNAIVAMETSSARIAGAPIADKNHVPFIYTSPYEGGDCKQYLFINTQVPPQQILPGLDYLRTTNSVKTWFLVGSDYAYGRATLVGARKAIEGFGGSIVGEEYNPVDAADWTPIISKVRSANPGAIVTATAGGAPNVSLLKQYQAAGLKAPIVSLSLDEGTAKSIGSAASGVLLTSDYFTALDNPENKAFLAAMQTKFGSKLETPNYLSVPTYDGVHAYALAAAAATSVAPDAIIGALPNVTWTGPRGPVQMNQEHHTALHVNLGQVQADGSIKILKDLGLLNSGDQCPQFK
jgi:urea transport system substrate-binding protein